MIDVLRLRDAGTMTRPRKSSVAGMVAESHPLHSKMGFPANMLLFPHLVPFSGNTSGINALLSLERNAELVAHLCGSPAAQLVEGVFKQVVTPHSDAQATVRSLVTSLDLAPAQQNAT